MSTGHLPCVGGQQAGIEAKLGTIAEEANLDVELVPVTCYCPACQSDFEPSALAYECPVCRQLSVHVRGGRGLELVSLEVL